MYTENDNIDWERINALSKLTPEELERMIAEEEMQVKKQIEGLEQK